MPRLVRDTLYRFVVVERPTLLVLANDDDFRLEATTISRISAGDDPIDLLDDKEFALAFWQHVRNRYDGLHVPADRDHLSYAALHYNCECTAWFEPQRHLRHVSTTPWSVGRRAS